MIGVITAVLAGSAAGLLVAVSSDHSLAAALAAGAAIFVVVLWALMPHQRAAWAEADAALSTKPKPERFVRHETGAKIGEDR
jgi:hypothetical protein